MNIKRHLLSILYSGHRHEDMTEALMCYVCGVKMKKWEAEHNRPKRIYPNEFIRKEPEYRPSQQTQAIGQLLEERLKTDKNYRKQVEKQINFKV